MAGLKKIGRLWLTWFTSNLTKAYFSLKQVHHAPGLCSTGFPYVVKAKGATIILGRGCTIHNDMRGNAIGRNHRSIFAATEPGALISIGNHVGISCSALVARKGITIEDDVLIGGNVVIYDTDFHPISPDLRLSRNPSDTPAEEVHIEKNVFIGAHSIILKGVTIGRNSVIGAGSVVTNPIPANQLWAGNPARFIRSI